MPYAQRDADGALLSLHREAQPEAGEFLDPGDPEVQAFLGPTAGNGAFERLDAGFIRVLEDLIDALLRRNVIAVTDLPAEAQRKLFLRKGRRKALPLAELNLLGDAPGSMPPPG